jgi:predicted house-cleaning noncanonical NTP pyrophosphatase (MazG superfamily)
LKLLEEANEVISSKNNQERSEEIADVYEILDTIIAEYGLSKKGINEFKLSKKEKN